MDGVYSFIFTAIRARYSLTHSQLPKMIGYWFMQIWKANTLTLSISSLEDTFHNASSVPTSEVIKKKSSILFLSLIYLFTSYGSNKWWGTIISRVLRCGWGGAWTASPQQQAQRELVQWYQQQVDPHPKGNDGVHHYFGGWPLIDPPFWAVHYQLDSELKNFSPIDDQETRCWLEQHDPAYPDNISRKYCTLGTLYIEGILLELWSEAYKRTIWAVTDEQLRRYLRIDYRHLPYI